MEERQATAVAPSTPHLDMLEAVKARATKAQAAAARARKAKAAAPTAAPKPVAAPTAPKSPPQGEQVPTEMLAAVHAAGIASRNSWQALGKAVLSAQSSLPWLTTKGLAESLRARYGALSYLSESSLSKAATVTSAFKEVSSETLAQRSLGFWHSAYLSFVKHGQMSASACASALIEGAIKIPKATSATRAVTLPRELVARLHKARGNTPLAEYLASLLPK